MVASGARLFGSKLDRPIFDSFQIALFKRFLQWNLDLTKCQGTGEIGYLYRGSVKISLVVSGASLYRGSLNRISTVFQIF